MYTPTCIDSLALHFPIVNTYMHEAHTHTYIHTYICVCMYVCLSLISYGPPFAVCGIAVIFLFHFVVGSFEGDGAEIDLQLHSTVGQAVTSAFPTSWDKLADVDTAVQVVGSVVQVLQDSCMLVCIMYHALWGYVTGVRDDLLSASFTVCGPWFIKK